MSTATLPPLDLGKEIERRRANLVELEELQQTQQNVNGRIAMLLTGSVTGPANHKATTGDTVRSVEKKLRTNTRRANTRSLADTIQEILVKDGGANTWTVHSISNAVEAGGYKTKSKNFQNVIRQCLATDGRFKKSHTERGGRDVVFSLKA